MQSSRPPKKALRLLAQPAYQEIRGGDRLEKNEPPAEPVPTNGLRRTFLPSEIHDNAKLEETTIQDLHRRQPRRTVPRIDAEQRTRVKRIVKVEIRLNPP